MTLGCDLTNFAQVLQSFSNFFCTFASSYDITPTHRATGSGKLHTHAY
ncbi:hypothetical protein HMPREF0649_02120 [Segatella buccae D17]|nr:hypothetical protein HMPREF0649_02120 [Segatella buccae D17]